MSDSIVYADTGCTNIDKRVTIYCLLGIDESLPTKVGDS